MSISEQITALTTDKTNIASAITAKGGTVASGDGFDNFADDIATIPSGGGSKYSISIDDMLGDVDSSGAYIIPTTTVNPTFTGVVSLPNNALQYRFYSQDNVGAVSFPNLTTIGQNALLYTFCNSGVTSFSATNLTTINTNGMQNAFNKCTSLNSVAFNNLTTIGNYGMQNAFNGCTSLRTELTLNNLTSVGSYGMSGAFYNCYYITKVNATSLTTINSYGMQQTFYTVLELQELNIPNITTISGNYAFYNICYGCNKLETVNMTIPACTGTYTLNQAFRGCVSLTTPPTVNLTELKGYAMAYCFYECTNLTSFTFPELLTISGGSALNYCFYNCRSLTSVTFTKLTKITSYASMNYAFQKCTGGLNVYFPELTTLSTGQTFQNTWNGANNAHVYFPSLTVAGFGSSKTHFSNACTSATGVTFHFPSAVQSKVEALTNYPNFGGTSTTVLFDL